MTARGSTPRTCSMPTCLRIVGARAVKRATGAAGTTTRTSTPRPSTVRRHLVALAGHRLRRELEELPRRRRQFRARALHRRRLPVDRVGRTGTGCGACATVEHASLACDRADGGSRQSRLGGVFASRGGAPRRRVARSRPLRGDQPEARLARRGVRARRLPSRLPAAAGQRGGGAPTVGRARGVLQGPWPFPRYQRALSAQSVVARKRDAGGVQRPDLPLGRRIV